MCVIGEVFLCEEVVPLAGLRARGRLNAGGRRMTGHGAVSGVLYARASMWAIHHALVKKRF